VTRNRHHYDHYHHHHHRRCQSPRRFDPPPPLMTSQQVSATSSRQTHADDHRPVRSRRTTRGDADGAASRADLDAARRRYFSIAEWNRQKVYHLRRASLRRACLTGIPVSWTKQAGLPDRQQCRSSVATTSRRRQVSRQTTASSADRKLQPLSGEIQSATKSYNNHVPAFLPPICERPSVVSNNNIGASRRRTRSKSSHKQTQQNQEVPAAVSYRAIDYTSYVNRCASTVSTLPEARHSHRTHTMPHKTPPRPEAHEQTVNTNAPQKPEACYSGLESDAAVRSTTADYQSVTPANVDLQKLKDVLENRPPSADRTHEDDADNNDEEMNSKKMHGQSSVDASNCVHLVDSGNTRQSADLTRYERQLSTYLH